MMKLLLIIISLVLASRDAYAQLDTTSFPTERQAIRDMLRQQKPGTRIDCSDFIAVGPKGDISFSFDEWVNVQKKQKLIFKSVQVVPGTEIIRIYQGHTAVLNFLADVKLVVDGRDLNIKVRRLEVYNKTASGWCRVAGQGTEVDENLFPVNSR